MIAFACACAKSMCVFGGRYHSCQVSYCWSILSRVPLVLSSQVSSVWLHNRVMPPERKRFVLVRWLEDENVGVVPVSAVHADSRVYVGALAKVKYDRKFYDAELLQTSGECVVLPAAYVRVLVAGE